MAKTPAQRGRFGRWLKAAREERYETQGDALQAMKRLAGLSISESEFAQWESGSRVPRPDNPKVARLYEFFGSEPDEAEDLADQSDVAAAIDRQTAMLKAVLDAILDRLPIPPDDPESDQIHRAVVDVEAARRGLAAQRTQTTSQPLPPSRGRRAKGRKSESREAGAT